jgi:tetratricopeptide (TPR) repeat protein
MPIGAGFVQTWDLHAIRRQLRPMGLDWDDGPLPDAPPEPFRYPQPLTAVGPPPAPKPASPKAPVEVVNDPQARWAVHSLVIAQQPLHPAGYIRRAEDLMAMNRVDEALHDTDAAIRLAPNWSPGYRTRARVRRASGDLRAALADLHRAVDLDPDSRPAHVDRANLAQQLRDDPTLLASARRMTELLPKVSGWWQILATGLLVADAPRRDVPAALAAAEKAMQLNPGNAYSHVVLGYALLESGRWEDARAEFTEGRKLRLVLPYDASAALGLALCAHRAGDDARARALFAQAVAGKDTGHFNTPLAERLFLRQYKESAAALGLPPPK